MTPLERKFREGGGSNRMGGGGMDIFWNHTMAREAADLCLRVLKESNKSGFDSYSVRNRVLIISHITFRYCRVHMFCEQPFSK